MVRLVILAVTLAALPASAAPVVFSAAGADPASIQATVDAFRASLGDPNNGNAAGSQPGGRREINWDGGGPAGAATIFPATMTTFQNRGAVFTTPGTGFEISGQPSPEFGDIDPSYPDFFTTFSPTSLFGVLGGNVMDIHFTVPGDDDAAYTTGFGAVFTDVDFANTTSLELFDLSDASLGVFFAPALSDGLSFLGVLFNAGEMAARVRITLGNAPLEPDEEEGDVVVMDDFIYAEPQPIPTPEPSGLSLLAASLRLAARVRRRRLG